MIHLMFPVTALSLALALNAPALAAQSAEENQYAGQVVSVRGNILMMTIKGYLDFAITVSPDVEVRLDGKVCKITDLKGGMRVRVIASRLATAVAIRIDAIDRYEEFENSHDGTFISVAGNTLEMMGNDRQTHARTLAADVVVTCDGMPCMARDLKAGMRLRVTVERAGNLLTTRIEALDKQSEFQKRD